MQGNLQKRPQIKILPALKVNGRHEAGQVDIDEVVTTVKSVLPQHLEGNIDTTINLLEKNLKIMAGKALTKEALTDLVRNAVDVVSGYGKLSVAASQVSFELESLLDAEEPIIGACDFISLAGGADVQADQKIGKKIFEPFFTTKHKGTGLGLAVSRKYVEMQGGTISVVANPNGGTIFRITLPKHQGEDTPAPNQNPTQFQQ